MPSPRILTSTGRALHQALMDVAALMEYYFNSLRECAFVGLVGFLVVVATIMVVCNSRTPWPASSNSVIDISSSRVAICIVGQARHFGLTGPTIKQHLLDTFKNAHLFLNVPLDDTSWKLAFLAGNSSSSAGSAGFAMAKIFRPFEIYESPQDVELLTQRGSPKGIQGLLQYFSLVEGCWDMVSSFERMSNIKYDWIIRARLDSFWTGPMPTQYGTRVYTIPTGVRFGGFNDRLGVGEREVSMVALRRSSILPYLHARGYRRQGSEMLFKSHVKMSRVQVSEESFPFCILSDRKFPWPPQVSDVPVMSITGKGPLNGAYCRPCRPAVSSEKAREMVSRLDKGSGWIPTEEGVDVELCDAHAEWEQGWRSIFDKFAGEQAAKVRKEQANSTYAECVKRNAAFRDLWRVWDAPSVEEICKLSPW